MLVRLRLSNLVCVCPPRPSSSKQTHHRLATPVCLQMQLEQHEKLWREFLDPVTNRKFYYNTTTNESYWARPAMDQFEVGEITLPAFIFVAHKNRLNKPPHPWGPPEDDDGQ